MEALMSSERINPEGLKKFVRHLCVVSKKYDDRESARKGLKTQIKKVKTISLAKNPKRWLVEKELKALNDKISLVLEKESKLLGIEEKDSALIAELQNKIQRLESEIVGRERSGEEKIKEMSDALTALREKVKQVAELKTGREQRIKELERRIKGAPPTATQKTLLLRGQIKALEERYNKMRPRYSREELSSVENRIRFLKDRLAEAS